MTAVRIHLVLSAVLMLHISGECFNIECDPNGCRIMDHTVFWVGGEDYAPEGCTYAASIMMMMCKTAGANSESWYFERIEDLIDPETIGPKPGCITGTCSPRSYTKPCITWVTKQIEDIEWTKEHYLDGDGCGKTNYPSYGEMLDWIKNARPFIVRELEKGSDHKHVVMVRGVRRGSGPISDNNFYLEVLDNNEPDRPDVDYAKYQEGTMFHPKYMTDAIIPDMLFPPLVGVEDHITISNADTILSHPTTGASYTAQFVDHPPTSFPPSEWHWTLSFPHESGDYVAADTTILSQSPTGMSQTTWDIGGFTLPQGYNWGRTEDNEVWGEVTVWGTDGDGVTHEDAAFVYYSAPPAPGFTTTVYPPDDELSVPVRMSFEWNGVGTADTYRLQIASDIEPVTDLVEISTSTTTYDTLLAPNTVYWWRIGPTNGWGTAWSAWQAFRTAQVPQTPQLISPANNATGVNEIPALQWSACDRADQYWVTWQMTDGGPIASDTGITGTTHLISVSTGMVEYWWMVTAIGPGGRSTSNMYTFTTEAGPPYVEQTEPLDGDTVDPHDVTLRWFGAGQVDHYRVSVYNESTGTLHQDSTLTLEEWTLSSLEYGASYTWQVTAVNSSGETDTEWRRFYTSDQSAPSPVPAASFPILAIAMFGLVVTGGVMLRKKRV